jgi:hypothetical protein
LVLNLGLTEGSHTNLSKGFLVPHSNAVQSAKSNSSFLVVEDSLFDQKRILSGSHNGAKLQYASTLKAARKHLRTAVFHDFFG